MFSLLFILFLVVSVSEQKITCYDDQFNFDDSVDHLPNFQNNFCIVKAVALPNCAALHIEYTALSNATIGCNSDNKTVSCTCNDVLYQPCNVLERLVSFTSVHPNISPCVRQRLFDHFFPNVVDYEAERGRIIHHLVRRGSVEKQSTVVDKEAIPLSRLMTEATINTRIGVTASRLGLVFAWVYSIIAMVSICWIAIYQLAWPYLIK